jgi:guanine deaminase
MQIAFEIRDHILSSIVAAEALDLGFGCPLYAFELALVGRGAAVRFRPQHRFESTAHNEIDKLFFGVAGHRRCSLTRNSLCGGLRQPRAGSVLISRTPRTAAGCRARLSALILRICGKLFGKHQEEAGMAYTVLRGGLVLDIGAGTADPADILIEDDTIREVGPPGCPAPADAREISAARRLIHPGLINAHTHSHGNLSKGMGDRWTLELLLAAAPWIGGGRAAEDLHLSAQIGAVEMVLKGCTACYDLFFEWPAPSPEGLALVGSAYAEVGLRAVIAPMVADRSFYEAIPGLADALPPGLRERVDALRLPPGEATLKAIRDGFHRWSFDRDRIRPAVAPTIPHHCSDAFILGCAGLARDFDVGLHSHVAESKVQAVTGIKVYGRTQTAHLDRLGILGPNLTVAHGVWLDRDDMSRLGGHGASVAHNPGSNMRLGSGLADARGMLECGVNLGIGTDGASCSDNQNMYEAMRLASFVSKVQGPEWQRWLTTREAALAATEGSARALGYGERIGRIAPGWQADLVLLDLDHPNWMPLNNPVNQLVHCEDGSAVDSVMIAGRIVVEHRRVLSVDLPRLRERAEAARDRLAAVNADNRRLCEALTPVVDSFCPGLAAAPYHVHRYGAAGRRSGRRAAARVLHH